MKRKELKTKNDIKGRLFRLAFGYTVVFISLLTIHLSLSITVSAQRDYFTPEEIELVRDAQEIDRRINVLVYAIDRRFAAIKIETGGVKPSKKEIEKWGELPASSRSEYLFDIRRILQKAIDDIDSLAERPDSAFIVDKDNKAASSYEKLFPKAMRSLAAAAARFGPILKAELDKQNSTAETGFILDSIDSCDQIVAALSKLPADAPAKKPKN